ncbi:MAG: undecaprenyl-diphosphate phosphatase [Actinobacteria bacterium]|nr:undecaprenyl-diphosphate phosphatase [Cyanobacteriota bacterium]MCL5772537.1 undecaprenyl-diphosphate phosphatase [Actinomycetota bacterium]
MSIVQSIVYGIVQGIAEFLPISSTAHLVLIPWFFGWKDPGIVFDVALHLGTAIAVILFFIKDWIILIRAGFTKPKSDNGKLFWFIVIATIPGGLAGVFLDKYMENLRNPLLIGIVLIAFGIILYLADKISKNEIELKNIGFLRSFIIGISQVFAVIPGISRSGVTMSAGRFSGIKREGIAKFTFLLSTPIILGDGLYHAKNLKNVPIDKAPFVIAILTSAIIGALSIKFLLNYLKKRGFGLFVIYRFALGVFVIVLYFIRLYK